MGFGSDIPKSVEGASYASVFRNGTGQRPNSAWYMFVPYGQPALGRRGVRTQTHTLVCARDGKGPEKCELYDDVGDPWQAKNIAPTQPDLVQKLTRDELLPWLQKMKDPWLADHAQGSDEHQP